MDQHEETYEEFTKRYRAEQGQPAQGPRFTAVNKQLILMGVAFVIALIFFKSISSGLDRAVEAEHAAKTESHRNSNPWAKD